MNEGVYIRYDVFVRETGSAILVRLDKREVWIPKSQMLDHWFGEGVEIPRWLAVEKGLV